MHKLMHGTPSAILWMNGPKIRTTVFVVRIYSGLVGINGFSVVTRFRALCLIGLSLLVLYFYQTCFSMFEVKFRFVFSHLQE